jgi:hypothetical protein
MDHSLGNAIGGRPFFENTLGDEILDFFVEKQVNVIIPAHWRASFRLKTHSWGRTTAGSAEMRELPNGFGGAYVVGKVTLRNGARIIEKTWPAVTKKGPPAPASSSSSRLARFQWARDLRVFGSVRM